MDPAEPRAQYYGAWDAFAADQASRLKDEEAAEAAASERCDSTRLAALRARRLRCRSATPCRACITRLRVATCADCVLRLGRALGLGDAAKAAATAAKREALRAAKAQWAATQDREAQAKARPSRSASQRRRCACL